MVKETITKYNSLMADWEKAAFENPDDNDIMSAIENNLENSRNKILQSLAYYKKTNAIKIKLYNEKNNQYSSRLGEIPKKISSEMELKKQKDLKERLYLYLLQKREETAIASISNKSNYSTIDKAGYSLKPIEPQESRLKTFAMLLGLVIPIAIIYLADLLNDKIISKKEIVAKTGAPIVAEITHYDGQDDMVIKKTRSVIAEQFRILRSNLQFLIPATEDNKTKVFLVCSTISGEGKSFVSNNLAGVLELTNKKVALLEFDLRKLKSINSIENEKFNRGITNYLVGQEDDLNKLFYSVNEFPNLHVFKTGPLPPNPAELMIGERMELLFKNLKANYDYIVLDSSPAGLVGDAFALDKFSDATVFIVRQRYSIKKQLDFISELKETGKFKNLVIVVNDINESVRNNYYGYGKAYGNGGYGKYYGDSNPYFDVPAKTWWQNIWKK
jgi:capsular exopolysaccharide synthesis family protein